MATENDTISSLVASLGDMQSKNAKQRARISVLEETAARLRGDKLSLKADLEAVRALLAELRGEAA